jgi:EAL domain-containing protein (putative c-di-GMP-specific phosphodiesterase class I)
MVGLLKSIGLSAALRGVTTEDQLALAIEVGADEVQGDALALPLTVAELTASVPPAPTIRLPGMRQSNATGK